MPTLSVPSSMTEHGWRDLIVGDRMRVDETFSSRVSSSGFSRSEWGMIMTAVDFEVRGEGDAAELVANTDNLDAILPELDKIVERMGANPPQSAGSSLSNLLEGGGGSFLKNVRSSLGLRNGVDQERRQEAVRLAEDYAEALQRHLEERGRWEEIRDTAIEQDRGGD
mgnify:CR=1 FL=1